MFLVQKGDVNQREKNVENLGAAIIN